MAKNSFLAEVTFKNNLFHCKKKTDKVSENFNDFIFLEILVIQTFQSIYRYIKVLKLR